jgi:hypothetical protein
MARDHDHGQIRMLCLHDLQHLESVETAALQPDVEEYEMRTTCFDGRQSIV